MKEDNEVLRGLAAVALIAAFFATITAYQWSWEGHAVAAGPGWPARSTEELRAAMQYHGTPWAEKDENGEWWFTRDGKPCRLFTEGCVEALMRRNIWTSQRSMSKPQ